MRSLVRHLALPIAMLALLAACASPVGSDDPADASSEPTESSDTPNAVATEEPFRGLPEDADAGLESPAGIVVGQGGLVHVVTYGSSSNPAVVHGATAEGQMVKVDVSADEGRPSTMDFVPTTSSFLLPEGVDPAQEVTFTLGDLGTVTVDEASPGAQSWVEILD